MRTNRLMYVTLYIIKHNTFAAYLNENLLPINIPNKKSLYFVGNILDW